MEKIKALLGSIRFQQLVIGVVLIILGYYGIVPQALADIIAGALGISIGVGTIDKAASSIGEVK